MITYDFIRSAIQAVALAMVLAASAYADAGKPLIHTFTSRTLTVNDRKAQLLGDRFVYWADDASGQFYVQYADADAPLPASLRIMLNDAQGRSIEAVSFKGIEGRKGSFTVETGALPLGDYTLAAQAVDADDRAMGDVATFAFKRTNDRHTTTALPADGIEIHVEPQDIAPDATWPMRVGVPMPRGAIVDVSALQLLEDDQPIRANITPVGWWSRGDSVKWVHVDFVARYNAGQPRTYRLVKQTRAQKLPGVTVDQTDQQITVDTGAVRFVVGRTSFAGIEKAWVDPTGQGRYNAASPIIDGKGGPYLVDSRLLRYEAALDTEAVVEVEEVGPSRVTIVASGWYRSNYNHPQALCLFKTRITAHAGEAALRVSQHTIIAFDTRQYRLADVGFDIAVPGSTFAIGADGEAIAGVLPKGQETVFIHQDRHDRFRLVGAEAREGKRSDGWFHLDSANGGIGVALRDVWQKYPKELELSRTGMTLHFWPKHSRRAFTIDEELTAKNLPMFLCYHHGDMLDLNLPTTYYAALMEHRETQWECNPAYALNGNGEGLAIANEFLIVPGATAASMPATAKLMQDDPAAHADLTWNATSGAMGDIAPPRPDLFPEIEAAVVDSMLSYARSVERGEAYGMWNYADTHNSYHETENRAMLHRTWLASHYHQVGYAWAMYFRTGDTRMLRWARANTDHFMNIDTVNYASLQENGRPTYKFHYPGAMYHCKALTHWGSRAWGMPARDSDAGLWGHWIDPEASLWAWLIGGNPRGKDIYNLWADAIHKHHKMYLAGVRRDVNTSLAYTLSYYQHTFDPDVLPAIHGMAASLRSVPLEKQMPGPLWHPQWITRYYDQTRDPQYIPLILHYGKMKSMSDGTTFSLSALAYRLSGDSDYLTIHLDGVRHIPLKLFDAPGDSYNDYGWHPSANAPNVVWGELLKQWLNAGITAIDQPRLEIGHYPFAPSDYRYAARPPGLVIYALDENDDAFALRGRIASYEGTLHATSMLIFDPSGKEIHHTPRLAGNGSSTTIDEAIPADGKRGLYRIEMRSPAVGVTGRLTTLPREAAVMPTGVAHRSANFGGYFMPLGTPEPMTLLLESEPKVSPFNRPPFNVRIEDARGNLIARKSLFSASEQSSTEIVLDPAKAALPWIIEGVGCGKLTFTYASDAQREGRIVTGIDAEDLRAIAERLP